MTITSLWALLCSVVLVPHNLGAFESLRNLVGNLFAFVLKWCKSTGKHSDLKWNVHFAPSICFLVCICAISTACRFRGNERNTTFALA